MSRLTFTSKNDENISKSVFKARNAKACNVCSVFSRVTGQTVPAQPQSVSTDVDCQYDWFYQNIDNVIGRVVKAALKERGPIFVQLRYEKRFWLSMSQHTNYLYTKRSTFCRASVILTEECCPGIRMMYSEVRSLQNQRA